MRWAMAMTAISAWLGRTTASAADWPQFLGPSRDGVSTESIEPWAASGPRVAWKTKVGAGFSGPVVAGGRVVLHHREDDNEVLEAFDAATGKSVWRAVQPTRYRDDFGFDEGPRGTPAIADGKVFAFGAAGRLSAVKLADGTALWSRAVGEELGAEKGFFGFACSPLVVGNLVVVQVGGRPGAGIAAFDVADGKTAWRATEDEAGYASPVLADVGGKPRIVAFDRAGVVVLEPKDGKVVARRAWRSRQGASVNAATPLVSKDGIFVTASYDTGAALFRLGDDGSLAPAWSGDDSISAHFATPVAMDGLLFGFHGRQERGASLRCIETTTGKVKWSEDGFGVGSLIRAGKRLLVFREDGELVMAEATAERWTPIARAQVTGTGTRAVAALSDGRWFGRDKRELFSLELTTKR